MKIKSVVFDMDGLMFNTEWLTFKLTQKNAAALGYKITLEMFKQTVGKRSPESKIYYKSVLGENFDFDLMRNMNISGFKEYIDKNGVPKKDGIDELLKYLSKNNISCAVATSTSTAVAEDILERAGILKYFSAAVFGDMVDHGKPAPDIFIEAAKRLGTPCHECMCLEDSYNGIRAGHSAGMITIMIPDMIPPNAEILNKVYTVAGNLLSIIDIIERMNGICL